MRWRTRLVAALLGGVALNMGVAWSCAVWAHTLSAEYWQGDSVPQRVRLEIPADMTARGREARTDLHAMWAQSSGVGVTHAHCDLYAIDLPFAASIKGASV